MSLWDSILDFVNKIVSPDWGALVLLVPLGVLVLVAGYLGWVVRRLATAGPRTTRPLPVPPPPPGVHLPGGSIAPFLAAAGAFAFLLSTLFIRVVPALDPTTKQPLAGHSSVVLEPVGILAIAVGIGALALGLLYWGREANRDYDKLEAPTALPVVVPAPPAGVHVPGPSFRPLLAAVAAASMLLGLVIGPLVFVAGVLMTVIGLLGWLGDARREYVEVVHADASGHLRNLPAPRFPTRTLLVFGVLFVGSLLVTEGVIPPRGPSTAGAGGAVGASGAPAASVRPAASGSSSGSPAASGAPGPSAAPPAASGAPGSAAPGGATTLTLSASGLAYDTDTLTAPANTPFQIAFTNNDAGIPHNVSIHQGSPTGAEVWRGEIFSGVDSRTYQVPALPAGTYGFVCSVHPNMTGTLTVR